MLGETVYVGGLQDCITLACNSCVNAGIPREARSLSFWVTPAGAMLLWCEVHDEAVAHVPNDKVAESLHAAIKMGCEHCSCHLPKKETH